MMLSYRLQSQTLLFHIVGFNLWVRVHMNITKTTNTLPPECEAFDLATSCTLFSREAPFGEHMLLSSSTIKLSTCFQK